MRTILSVIELTNETENSLEIMDTTNTTLMVDNKTNHSEECGVYNDEYQIISSTVQVRVILFVYFQLLILFNILQFMKLLSKSLQKYFLLFSGGVKAPFFQLLD